MADEASEKAEGKGKKKLPIKTVLLVLGLLIGEGVGVVAFLKFMGKPDPVQGQGLIDDELTEMERIQEMLVVADRFPNHHTGRTWLWDTEVQVQLKAKNLGAVTETLEGRRAEIKTGVGRIVRAAHHNYFTEANLATLTRQLSAYLNEVFGDGHDGEPRIARVFISKCVGFPADY